MLARKIPFSAWEIKSPGASLWKGVKPENVQLTEVPLGLQPTPYIIAKMMERKWKGRVKNIQVKLIHNGQKIAFLLEWEDPSRDLEITDTDIFPDGAGILFPLKGDAPIVTMGTAEQPVNAWHWRADRPGRGRNNVAAGIGSTRVTDENMITVGAEWENGSWRVVFSRPLQVNASEEDAIRLKVGETYKAGFAVWEGSNGERAGVKSFSPNWLEITLEA